MKKYVGQTARFYMPLCDKSIFEGTILEVNKPSKRNNKTSRKVWIITNPTKSSGIGAEIGIITDIECLRNLPKSIL